MVLEVRSLIGPFIDGTLLAEKAVLLTAFDGEIVLGILWMLLPWFICKSV